MSRFYKANGKRKADETDVQNTIPIRHPLAEFTLPLTSLECGTINTASKYPKEEGQKSRSFSMP